MANTHSPDTDVSVEEQADETERHEANGHSLVVVEEWIPGDEPTDAEVDLTNGPEYRTRYWRCQYCGQERNRPSEFREPCDGEARSHPLRDGHYSIEEARTRRAVTQEMEIRFGEIGSRYTVESSSGNDYEVDVAGKTCTCPDFRKRRPEKGCKHLRRVDLAIRLGKVPRPNGRFLR